MSDAVLDFARLDRTGTAEAVLCASKSPTQIDAILAQAASLGKPMLLTRLEPPAFEALALEHQARLSYDLLSRTAVFGEAPTGERRTGIGIITAGTSDLGVAFEAARTLTFHGYDAPVISDVGVAGLWRLLDRLEEIRRLRVIIAVAGMEGALFSVLAGLVSAPVIALPSSVGYGVATGGRVALEAALASCAPGLTVVNIDNGFGAACAAISMMKLTHD